MSPRCLHEFSIYLDDRPGELAGVLEAVAAAGVQIESMSVSEHNGRGLVRLLGDPVEQLRAVCESLTESGIGPILEAEVVAVETGEREGTLRELAKTMADERVNVRYAYMAPSRNGRPELCVLRVDDPGFVVRRLSEADLPTGVIAPERPTDSGAA
ncbi:MAG: hypothetical protein AAFR38_01550 [Planctomycetota bacterium]